MTCMNLKSQPLDFGTVLVCACITYRAYGMRKGKGDRGDIRDGQNLDAIFRAELIVIEWQGDGEEGWAQTAGQYSRWERTRDRI